MFEEGIKFPLEGEDAVKRIMIGGLLGIFSFLIVPIFAIVGYYVEVARAGVEEAPEPPEFTDWGDLIVKGIVGTVITIAYAIIPIFLVMFTTGIGFAGASQGGRPAASSAASAPSGSSSHSSHSSSCTTRFRRQS